jgi:predicted metalloprotease
VKLKKLRRRPGGVIDRRAQGPTGGGFAGRMPGGGIPLPGGKGGVGVVGILVLLAIVFVLPRLSGGGFGDLGDATSGFDGTGGAPVGSQTEVEPDDPTGAFVSAVADDVNTAWDEVFARAGKVYEDPDVVLYRGSTPTACGLGQAGMGPFYCPGDRTVYLDTSFFKELEQRFGAPGDFAQAYVIAHEIGHHVQTLLGIERQVRQAQRDDPGSANELSVRMELQADCFAGVWARSAQAAGVLQQGDVEEGLRAAEQIGDDTLQREAGMDVSPESFTHGTSEQRRTWLGTGIQVGNPDACDTFSTDL